MCDSPSRHDVSRLAGAVLALRPLADELPHPVQLIAGDGGGRPTGVPSLDLLNRIASRLGAPPFGLAGAHDRSVFARIVSNRLAFGAAPDAADSAVGTGATAVDTGPTDTGAIRTATIDPATIDTGAIDPRASDACPIDARAIDAIVDHVASRSFDARCARAEVRSHDGVALNAVAAGDRHRPAVVIASVCGMPARLCEPWIRRLADDWFVITWETRGLFGPSRRAEGLDCSVEAQTADAFAVMDHFGVRRAHVMGMCGGALLALRAAAHAPARVTSLSLWHGDLELGPACPKTPHQRDLQALMAMATEQRVDLHTLHAVLCQTVSARVPDDLGPLILYPYARPDLLATYCRLNGQIMRTSVASCLPLIRQPALVVTSDRDHTAHPEASKQVAAALPRSVLRTLASGDHLSLFRGPADLLQAACAFIRETAPPV